MDIDYHSWNLDDWVKMFEDIYKNRNEHKSEEEIWLHVVEEVAELAEDLRKQHIFPRQNSKKETEGILVNIPDTFAWFSAFIAKKRFSMEDIVWNKFPNICSYCFMETNCSCIGRSKAYSDSEKDRGYTAKEKREKELESYRAKKKGRFPDTLYGWQLMFKKIYGNVNRVQSIEQIGFHLMEEIGEVAKEIRRSNTEELKDELADVFAWIMGLILKCEDLLAKEILSSKLLWDRYPNSCHECEANPCTCDGSHRKPRGEVS
ncbi:MAG: MazG nucleotide pyrophosphohydrolase domain-containing protein [Candidatus Odinarchaeota archaeon]